MEATRLSSLVVLLLSLLHLGHSSNDRLIGGENINQPVPYQVSLQMFRNNKWSHTCGGAIISPNHVLTAGHCVKGLNPQVLSVLAGITRLSAWDGSRHFVAAYHIHENYTNYWSNDIALVRITPPLFLDGVAINAIEFRNTTRIGHGVALTLTGWGSIYQNGTGPLPDQLRRLTTFSLSDERCRTYFSRLEPNGLCTLREVERGACNGDSGGPLTSFDMTELVGLVSFGSKRCASGYPDFFTRVSEYVEWITQKMALP